MKTISRVHALALTALTVLSCWGEAHLSRLAVAAEADGSLDVDCFVEEPDDVRTVRAEVLLNDMVVAKVDDPACFRAVPGRVEALRHQIMLSVKSVQTWTAETPVLYAVRVTLLNARGKSVGTSTTRVGFRSVEVRDGLYVNGRKIRLKGVICRPTVFPCTRNHVIALKALGANAVRFADGAPDPAFIDACDELGLYVVDEFPPNPASNMDEILAVRIVRDMNHPSVVLWAHPQAEGSASVRCDDAFKLWDAQHRFVIHPGRNDGTFNCLENMDWNRLANALKQPQLVLPTSILPARGAGGLAAGFADYWQLLQASPNGVGCFIGELTDYLSATSPKLPPFDAVREVWSPVSCSYANSHLTYNNSYDFVNLGTCVCTWSALSWANGTERRLAAARELCPPCPAGRTTRTLVPRLPSGTEALEISVADKLGVEVARHHFRLARSAIMANGRTAPPPNWLAPPRFVTLAYSNAVTTVSNVPRHTAVYYDDPSAQRQFTCVWQKLDECNYRLDYTCKFAGTIAASGISFDVAESCVKSHVWFGKGPGDVWANRVSGQLFGRWTAETKGFFQDIEWMEFETTAGTLRFTVLAGPSIFGVFPASDPSSAHLYEFPPLLGLGVWSCIPPLGNGDMEVRALGPSSRMNYSSSSVGGALLISYRPSRR